MYDTGSPSSPPGSYRAANDNNDGWTAPLETALRVFARHGLAASEAVRDAARAAQAAGEAGQSAYWMEVSRVFHPTMKRAVTRSGLSRSRTTSAGI
jgi:hypothetical protein